MSKSDASFEAIRGAIRTLWRSDDLNSVRVEPAAGMLLFSDPTDVAAFAVLDGYPDREFPKAYGDFKELYRANRRVWDERTLSFVVCRSSERPEDDGYYAALESDPLFCRKYVIRAHETVPAQREELLRLPFFPLPAEGDGGLQRSAAAQDVLKWAGVSGSFARHLIEPGKRSAERIATGLGDGRESLPAVLEPRREERLMVEPPQVSSRLMSLRVEGFRAYREPQTFDLDGSIIVLYGPNGLGKTSVFDAIDYACTGRIGRLCRTKRRQADFARLATHLDKTPGSGSVVLVVRDDRGDGREWKLQRGTGDWGTAWIDGEEADRKAVINKLTQARWVDATPRQPTLDSLFRATHLFSQDDQELLTEFRKGSVIPETFVSEMLSLQDYSQGLSKLKDVLGRLLGQREAAETDLAGLREERVSLERSIEDDGSVVDGEEPAPIESLISDLREDVARSAWGLPALAEASTIGALAEWHEVAVSDAQWKTERISVAKALRDELDGHHRRIRERADGQVEIGELEGQLAEIHEEERVLKGRAEVEGAELEAAEERGSELRARREELRSARAAFARCEDVSGEAAAVAAKRQRLAGERGDIDVALATVEAELSEAREEVSECDRAVEADRAEVRKLEALRGDLSRFAEDEAAKSDLERRFAGAEEKLRAAERLRAGAEEELGVAGEARELREPEYRRAVRAQAERDRLLDEIQGHVRDHYCPLCGSEFESKATLVASIRGQRDLRGREAGVTSVYQKLVGEEAEARDRWQAAAVAVDRVRAAAEELFGQKEAVEHGVREFRARLRGAGFREDAGAEEVEEVLRQRCEALRERLTAGAERVEGATGRLKRLEASRNDGRARRQGIQERVAALDREVQELTEQGKRWAAEVERVLPGSQDVESDLRAESGGVDEAIAAGLATLQEMKARRDGSKKVLQGLDARKRGLVQRRTLVVGTLETVNGLLAAFREKLASVGVSGDGDVDSLDGVIREGTESRDAVAALADRSAVVLGALRAREVRRRVDEGRQRLEALDVEIRDCEGRIGRIKGAMATCVSIDGLLKQEQRGSIERHIAAYGPMISMIQQRLRAVYGFGGVQLEARGGEAKVRVEWRSKGVHVPPTDFFSDSQKQILMLSIFIAGGLRQNWSGFAPVLLDDPVTHFDDLNAYAFVELLRGLVATSSNEWQFVVSTCEQRLFDLMKRKCSHLPSGAVFYEFLGMTDKGPIVERR